jgi:hypothetical protein
LHAQIFIDSLKGMAPDVVDAAMRRVEETFVPTAACPFPVPAHIRQHVANADTALHSLVAEEAWNAALAWTRNWYLGVDLGFDRRAPELEEKQRRGIIAAGGFEHVSTCSLEELKWAQKKFLENYAHQETVERDGALIGRGEAVKILTRLRSPGPVPMNRALPPAERNTDGPFAPSGKPDKSIYVPLTQAQEDSRRQILRQQAQQIIEKYSAKVAAL